MPETLTIELKADQPHPDLNAPARQPAPSPLVSPGPGLPPAFSQPTRPQSGPILPPPPMFFKKEYLDLKPDAALQKAQGEARGSGLSVEDANTIGRAVADYVLAHSDAPDTVYKRKLLAGQEAGLSDEENMRAARKASDEAYERRKRERASSEEMYGNGKPPSPPNRINIGLPDSPPPEFDPVAVARQQMERELQAQQVEAARMLIDKDFRERKENQEKLKQQQLADAEEMDRLKEERQKQRLAEEAYAARLATDPTLRAWEARERERTAKEEAEATDAARRAIDPEYKKRREEEEMEQAKNKANAPFQKTSGVVGNVVSGLSGVASGGGAPSVAGAGASLVGTLGLGPVAIAAGTVAAALGFAAASAMKFSDELHQQADKLAPYSGQISVAQAMADIRETLGDIARAERLGPELANFIETQSRNDELRRNIEAEFQKKMLQWFGDTSDVWKDLALELKLIAQLVGAIIGAMIPGRDLFKILKDQLKEQMEANRLAKERDEKTVGEKIFWDLMGLKLPNAGGELGAGAVGVQGINMPAMGGF